MINNEIRKDIVVFQGVNFIRYLDSKVVSDSRYYKAWVTFQGKRIKTYLHRYIWMLANGEIPEGYHIHHKDGNHLNNALENFECITATEHISAHYHEKDSEWKAAKTHTLLTVAQEAAKGWHASTEGREWHSQHGKANWAGRVAEPATCTVCGKQYESRDARKGQLKYCSINCNAKARLKSGVDDIVQSCFVCSKEFVKNKYARKVCCSMSCGAKMREAAKKRP